MFYPSAARKCNPPRLNIVFHQDAGVEYDDLTVEIQNIGFNEALLLQARLGPKPKSSALLRKEMFAYRDRRFDLLKDYASQSIMGKQHIDLAVGRPAWYEDVLLLLDYEDHSGLTAYQTQFSFTTFPGRAPSVLCRYVERLR